MLNFSLDNHIIFISPIKAKLFAQQAGLKQKCSIYFYYSIYFYFLFT